MASIFVNAAWSINEIWEPSPAIISSKPSPGRRSTPALLTWISRCPYAAWICPKTMPMSSSSDTSPPKALWPAPSSRRTVSSAASLLRSWAATVAPSSANRKAMACPSPEPAPVMQAIFPSRRLAMGSPRVRSDVSRDGRRRPRHNRRLERVLSGGRPLFRRPPRIPTTGVAHPRGRSDRLPAPTTGPWADAPRIRHHTSRSDSRRSA